MASGIFSRIRARVSKTTGRTIKFATPAFEANLSSLVPLPALLLQRLGIKGGYVVAGKRPSVRSTIVTPTAMRKAQLEREEGRPLSRSDVVRVHHARRFLADYLKQKLRLDPRLDDYSLFPSWWNTDRTFRENWMADHRRFLLLAEARTGFRYELNGETGEWTKVAVPGATRKVMSGADWLFYTRHYYANEELYGPIGRELMELPPGEVSPRTVRVHRRSPGRANRTGRSQGSYRVVVRRAAGGGRPR